MAWIYVITNVLNQCQYVGQTVDLDNRWYEHLVAAKSPTRYSAKSLHYGMRKHGVEHFKLDVLEECELDKLDERERYWITKLNTNVTKGGRGYNLNAGGATPSKHRDKLSEAQRGERSHWFGRKHTEETKRKQSLAHKGRIRSVEHCQNISLARKGQVRPQSENERLKRKETMKQYARPVLQCSLEGEALRAFASMKQAIEWLKEQGLASAARSHVRECLNGKRKSAYGYTWKDGDQP